MALHLFAGLRVRDYEAARGWYDRVLGEPTFLPHATEAVWTVAEDRSVYVVEDAERAGGGLVTLALDDLDVHEKRLRDSGLIFTEQTHGAAPRRLVVRDVDGNTLTFFENPARSADETSPEPVSRNDP